MKKKSENILKVLGEYDDQKSANRAVMQALLDQGIESGEILEVSNFFYFDNEKDAKLAEEELSDIGFAIETVYKHEDNDELPWTVICTIRLPLKEDKIHRLTDFLNELAARYGGKYDGWEVGIDPDAKDLEGLGL